MGFTVDRRHMTPGERNSDTGELRAKIKGEGLAPQGDPAAPRAMLFDQLMGRFHPHDRPVQGRRALGSTEVGISEGEDTTV